MLQGALALMAGFRALLSEAPLRQWLTRMLALLFLLMLLISGGAFALFAWGLESWLPQGDSWYMTILEPVLWVAAVLCSLLLAAVTYTLLAAIALAPWLDELAARAETPGRDCPVAGFWSGMVQSCWHTLMPLLGLLPYALLALPCMLIPVIGIPLATAIWWLGSLRFLSFELSDTPASRRQMDWPQRKAHVSANRLFYLGFSGLASLILMIPLFNILVVPAAVVGLSRHMDRLS